MKLPKGANADIPKKKLTDYLLSETHPVGKLKAEFFRSVGIDRTTVSRFEKDLRRIARNGDVHDVLESIHGIKYILDGSIKTPTGKIILLRTIWIIEAGQGRPRFVTAYPV